MRIFNLDDIKPQDVYRVYKNGNNLVILYVMCHTTVFPNLTPEEMDVLIKRLQEKFSKERIILEVYENEYEAKNRR